ncbi:MAG: ATP-binding protein [Deltaproteobacteria bacterium]|nr:ATP-binding protein [Deltaproteobacteria bacterium]
MRKTTFKIRRRVITLFLFCVMSVVVFAGFSFQIHQDIGRRLRLLELTNDMLHNILEARRFEKNFLLYKHPASLKEALDYAGRVEGLYQEHEPEILRMKRGPGDPEFGRLLSEYKSVLAQIQRQAGPGSAETAPASPYLEESVRNVGQNLVEMTERWEKEERAQIDRLFQRAMYLFLMSILIFIFLGILVAFYLARLLVRPMIRMQNAMEKIAHGDFTSLPETSRAEEFHSLFRAFNRMIRELEEHQEELLQSRKIAAIGTLTSGIAHELNNPINNIVLTAESLQEDFSQLEQKEALGLIHDILIQADRASEIVKGLLDFSRSERPEFEPLAISAVIDETLKLVRNQVMLSGIQVEKDIPPEVPLVSGDRKSLQQVFLNLFINAIQAMPDGGLLQIGVHQEDGRWLKIEVGDTGAGIDPEHLPRIFDPFYTTKEVGRGTGLGLSVTYGIIEKHGGHIEAHSKKGQGATFTITLPIAQEKAPDSA